MLRSLKHVCVWLICVVFFSVHGAEQDTLDTSSQWIETGVASVYASKFQGRLTANGERYNSQALTAAHRSLPFGTKLRVTSLTNGRTVLVRINDRGPFIEGRIIDLSRASAHALRLHGLMHVEIELLP